MLLHLFILGAFGGVWWPGIEIDAPRPGGGDPWWMSLLMIVVGGVSAIGISQATPLGVETVTGIAVAIASGKVGAAVVRAIISAGKR
jgi:hypothetical protein